MLTLVGSATTEQIESIRDGLQDLMRTIPEVRSVVVHIDAGLLPGNATLAFDVAFDSAADWQVYRVHPEHVDLVAKRIAPILESKSFLQSLQGQ